MIPDMSNTYAIFKPYQLFGKTVGTFGTRGTLGTCGTDGTPGTDKNMVIANVYNTLAIIVPF